jgi:2-dehydro-3-deoxyphosphogalactonate aldolase
LPADTRLLPVGGITPENMSSYLNAGATGFGIGSALYKPGMKATQVQANAMSFISACRGSPLSH